MYKPVRKPSLTIKMALKGKNDETMMTQQLTQLIMLSNLIGKYRAFVHYLFMNTELNVAIPGVANATKLFSLATNFICKCVTVNEWNLLPYIFSLPSCKLYSLWNCFVYLHLFFLDC